MVVRRPGASVQNILLVDADLHVLEASAAARAALAPYVADPVGLALDEILRQLGVVEAGVCRRWRRWLSSPDPSVWLDVVHVRCAEHVGPVAVALSPGPARPDSSTFLVSGRTVVPEAAPAATRPFSARKLLVDLISHELRAPLAIIRGYAEMLERDVPEEPRRLRRYSRAIVSQVDNALAFSERLAAQYQRLGSDGTDFAFHAVECDVAQLAADTVERFQVATPQHNIRCVCPASPVLILGDPVLLEHALNNLIENAVKHSPAATVVEVRVTPADGAVDVAVIDCGQGIPQDQLDRIFEAYQRVRGAAPRPGQGLGLYVAARVIAAHAGKVWARSAGTEGAVVGFTLPLAAPSRTGSDAATT